MQCVYLNWKKTILQIFKFINTSTDKIKGNNNSSYQKLKN